MIELVLKVAAGFFDFFKPTPPAQKLRRKIARALRKVSDRAARRALRDELRKSSRGRADAPK